jgi:hypothetical protein
MQVTRDYLEDFAVKGISTFKEIPLHGWEMDHGGAVTLDDKDGHSITYVHWDDWSADKPWKIKQGTDKRWTFVLLRDKDSNIVGEHGWEFEGLVEPVMLREWFRAHLGFNE